MKKTMVILATFCAAGLLSANAADVKENWKSNCIKCHGESGDGKTTTGKMLKIRDLTDAKVQEALKDEEMSKAIKDGVKDGDTVKMKAFGETLNADETKELVKFVRGLKK